MYTFFCNFINFFFVHCISSFQIEFSVRIEFIFKFSPFCISYRRSYNYYSLSNPIGSDSD
nr:MAG TPA: hypothetical protein [Caudoviricetes sp.]